MATEEQRQEYQRQQALKIADIFSRINMKGNSSSGCSTCKNKRGIPENGYENCVVCMADYIEQERLRKLPGYKFFGVLSTITFLIVLAILAHAGWSFYSHWVASFFLDLIALSIMWKLHGMVMCRRSGQLSLEAQ